MLNELLWKHFYEGIQDGRMRHLSQSEVERIVDEHLLVDDPISELSKSDLKALRSFLIRDVGYELNNDYYDELIQFPIYEIPARLWDNFGWSIFAENRDLPRFVMIKSEVPELRQIKKKGRLLTPENKLCYFRDPNVWCRSCLTVLKERLTICRQLYHGPGSRPLYFSKKYFKGLMRSIRKSTGKKELNVMDLGGMLGGALIDAKKLDPNIVTHNLTIDTSPSMFPVDELIYCPAERMSSSLIGKMDFIMSCMAFCYFKLPSKALKNVIECLSPGGQAVLSIHPYGFPFSHDMPEFYKALVGLDELQKQGKIRSYSMSGYAGQVHMCEIDTKSSGLPTFTLYLEK